MLHAIKKLHFYKRISYMVKRNLRMKRKRFFTDWLNCGMRALNCILNGDMKGNDNYSNHNLLHTYYYMIGDFR